MHDKNCGQTKTLAQDVAPGLAPKRWSHPRKFWAHRTRRSLHTPIILQKAGRQSGTPHTSIGRGAHNAMQQQPLISTLPTSALLAAIAPSIRQSRRRLRRGSDADSPDSSFSSREGDTLSDQSNASCPCFVIDQKRVRDTISFAKRCSERKER